MRRLELFGAIGHHLQGESDFDFLVEFDSRAPGNYPDAYFSLRGPLEALTGRLVDLAVASAIKNSYFRQVVERSKTLLYAD